MTDRELIQQALEVLEHLYRTGDTQVFDMCYAPELIPALRERLAQPEEEPVAYYHPHKGFYWAKPTRISAPTAVDVKPLPLYTASPQRKWVGLTEADWKHLYDEAAMGQELDEFAEAIEAKLKEKNT